MNPIKYCGLTLDGVWKYGYPIKQGALYFIQNEKGGNTPVIENTLSPFTGKKCVNGEEIYQGTIVFVEEEEGIDNPKDVRYYLVIVWIPEWCLFASLHLDEYQKYLKDGAEALDESMFWTYTMEGSEEHFHYAGNIHQNPELL